METECTGKANSSSTAANAVSQLQSTVANLRDQLEECKSQVFELNSLQYQFRGTVNSLFRKMDKENAKVPAPGFVVTDSESTDSETQTCCELLPRRWNSDLSLDQDGKSQGKRYHHRNDYASLYLSTEAMLAPPVIRAMTQKKHTPKPKLTGRLDVSYGLAKRPADNMLLSDLGLTSQAPEFSQSEFNLSSEDHWLKEGQKGNGRVRFLSHDDGQPRISMVNDGDEDLELMHELPCQSQIFHSHSGSWATLTHSERDVSELDSNLSLNCQDENNKPFTSSTPCKGFRSKFKQSVSFHELLPSKATQSMPDLPKQNRTTSEVTGGTTRRPLPLSAHSVETDNHSVNSKRHSLSSMEHRSQTLTSTSARRSSLAGDTLSGPYVPSAITSLFLGGRVKALHGGHLVVTGVVWYRGKLPGLNEDIVGIELDQVGLGGDGTYQGHRYFRCAPGRGLFVPFGKIIMAWPTHSQ